MSASSRLLENLTRVLRSSWGLDVVSPPFAIQRYNAAVREIDHGEWAVPTFGRSVFSVQRPASSVQCPVSIPPVSCLAVADGPPRPTRPPPLAPFPRFDLG